ncbi:hypothetical protein TUM4438_03160 [Shewanella sairae]|uniref:Uncharacterized protein n=1 Tax=Shewanella sairae TaxID=190310 RepID=A0ABQ4P076_9GAMM|nr:hypothetical protein [Shewanella sairae]MCL1129630.1 hypothetical protein [Shewanella sairae]GIU40886.1 hypothetical protein TUM4438_03160 [Shewanella sairae]
MRPYKLALAIALAVVPITSAVAATTNTATIIKKSQAATGFVNLFYEQASGDCLVLK